MSEIDGLANGLDQSGEANTGPLIKECDMSNFMADVVEKSMTVPVLVSFYSAWSENCKKLTPILEKLVTQAAGAVHMVRVDFEKCQQLAAQMKIQSVPTVVAFSGQRPVDAFAGVKSEAEVKEFISRFAPDMQPSPVEQIIEQAAALYEQEDYQSAGGFYSQALQAEADNAEAISGLVLCLIKMDDHENAKTVLASTPKQHENHAAIVSARAALEMAEQLGALGDPAELEKAIAEDENNHQARFDLALNLWASGRQEEAANNLLDIVSRDRSWDEDGARKQLVKFFEIMGPADPFTVQVRRKLSSLLFS